MKKPLILIIFILIVFMPLNSYCETADSAYENLIKSSEKYTNIIFGQDGSSVNINELMSTLFEITGKEIKTISKEMFKTFCIILMIIIVLTVLNCFISSETVVQTAVFSCILFCSLFIGKTFNEVAQLGIEEIRNIREYMNIAFPGYITLLASSGYSSTAITMRGIFIMISNIIAVLIDNIIVPLLYLAAILGISGGVSKSGEINKITKFIIKSVKYIIGIILTVFSSIIAFAGFASSATDSLTIKTAKYALTNFVPVVGNCLAETLNSIINTSVLLKNIAGYVGVFAVFFMVISPILKFFLASVMFKCLSLISSLVSDKGLTEVLEISSVVLTTFGALLVFLSAIYVMIFGIIASLGV